MNDFERVKSDSFVTIANAFLKDKNLSNKTKGVLAMILALPDNWDFSIKGMVTVTKDGEASLRSAINEMKENGYCAIKPVRINNKIARWKYLFSGEKLTEKLLCDFLQVENLNIENRAQYNNILNEYNKEIEKEDNNKSLSSKKKRFSKPTIEQIEAYIQKKGFHFDAEQFFDYYESKGWMVGSNHMKDWEAACRTWEHNRKSQENKEEPTEETACAMDPKEWLNIVVWLQENAYKIHSQIDSKMFCEMKAMAGDSKLLAEIIIEIGELAEYNSVDVMTEFRRILKEGKR